MRITLIECLIVILILAILGALALGPGNARRETQYECYEGHMYIVDGRVRIPMRRKYGYVEC